MAHWLIILIIVAIIIAIYFMFFYSTAAPLASWGINTVKLAIAPTTVTCGSGTKFVCKIDAQGCADNAVPRNFKVELYDDELMVDLLATHLSASGTIHGISPVQITGSVLFNWSKTYTFNLTCNSDCYVDGPAGNSGESDPKVYAVFTIMHGTPKPSKESARVQIYCVKA
jgi:hypothetical protein